VALAGRHAASLAEVPHGTRRPASKPTIARRLNSTSGAQQSGLASAQLDMSLLAALALRGGRAEAAGDEAPVAEAASEPTGSPPGSA
jgi:hypothetical protein